MSELRVNVTCDATGFNRVLKQAQTNAAAFNRSLVAQSREAQINSRSTRQFAEAGSKGARLANAGAAIAGVPGLGQVGELTSAGVSGYFGLKDAASGLGMSMAKAAGALAVFAASAYAVNRAWEELKNMTAAINEETRSIVAERRVQKETTTAYIKALDENRKDLSDADYKRLKVGAGSMDPKERKKAFEEIRSRFGGTVLNKELAKDLERQRAENIKDPHERARALENIRYREERDKLSARVGKDPSQATRALVNQMNYEQEVEHRNNLEKIMQQQLDEQKKISQNTRTTPQTPFF